MKALVEQLEQVCKDHPFKEKVLIVDSYAVGEQITNAYVKAGFLAINLKTKTVRDLAVEMVDLVSNESYNYLELSVGVHISYSLLKRLSDNNQLSYFDGIEITPSISTNIFQIITDLRLAGFTSENLTKAAFISSEKANDLVIIMAAYENSLREHQWMDDAALFQKARQVARPSKKTIYLLQSNLSLTYLENQLLEQFLPSMFIKLPLTKVYRIPTPEHGSHRAIEWGTPTAFSYLYQLEDASENPNLSLFTAKTEEVELKRILEQIKTAGTSLDDSVIFYTKTEPYVTTAYQLSEKYDVPVTYGDGLPISFSRPGRLVSGVLKWMNDHYSVQTFIELINEGLIELPEAAPSKSKISKLLRSAKVGREQSRYISQLKIEIQRLNEKVKQASTDEQKDYYQKQINDIAWLHEWFAKLFKELPVMEKEMNYRELLTSISQLLRNHCKITSALDERAKTVIIEKVDMILPYADEQLANFDAFEKIRDLILSLRVNQSGPKPGHLHITSFKKGCLQ